MADVFVSYKREDREIVRPLVRALQERGFTVWWDSRIETGANWMACIKRALDNAASVLVVWTPQSVAADRTYVSEVVAVEANEGWQRNVLLPVRMQNGPFPFPHNLRQAEDLSDWQGNADDPALARLARDIAKHSGERGPPEPTELAAWLTAEETNNADAYRAFAQTYPHSRFSTEAEPRAAEIEQRVADIEMSKAAAARIVEQFSREIGKPSFAPPVPMEKIEGTKATAFTPEELFERLGQGAKTVLQAAPGSGKTVSLLDWALGYSGTDQNRIGVFLRLKEIANTGDELIAHVARLESTGQVSEGAWEALARSGILTLFCDGWNELSDQERDVVGTKLDIFSRGYPSAGLVVGSRPVAPAALKGQHMLLSLRRLTFEQVSAIVENRLGDRAPAALAELRQSRPLRDLVRTPFFLSAFCVTRQAGETPATREGLVRGMILAGEQRDEHAGPLRRVFGGQQTKYLRALAVEMLKRQQAELGNDDARRAVNRESMALLEEGLASERADERVVLDTLRDHHYLIEHTGSDPSFRFQHQLINEWYASEEVRRIALLALSDEPARRTLDRDILDNTAWEEAILFAVERPDDTDDAVPATSNLILRAIGIDPDFAADLIALAPREVWLQIGAAVRSFVEEWSLTAKRRVIRFVMRCGKDDFSEIAWNAIAAEPSGNVAQALETHFFPHPAILGPDWRRKCAALSAKGRESLLTMLASNSGLQGAAMAVEAAVTDEEPEVQAAVAERLDFHRFQDELTELLDAAHPETWDEIVRKRNIDGLWEAPWRERAVAAAHRVFSGLAPGPQRIHWALRLRELGEDVSLDLVSQLLGIEFKDHGGEDGLYARVAEVEGDCLSRALLERVLEGQRVTYHASRYIKSDTRIDQERLLEACRTKPQFQRHHLLSPLLSAASLKTLLSEALALHRELTTLAGRARNAVYEEYNVRRDALISADKNTLAQVILDWAPATTTEIAEVSHIIMRAYTTDFGHDEREPLRPELREPLVARLAEWSSQVITDASGSRHTLHSVAEAMAVFPSTSLLEPLRSLLSEDLRRWRAEKEEFKATIARGEPPDPASGARMSYGIRYGQNMLSLATGRNADIEGDEHGEGEPVPSPEMTDAVVDVLSEFLLDHEFGEQAARALATLRPDPITEIGKPNRFQSYDLRIVPSRQIFRARQGTQPIDPTAKRVINAIRQLCADGSAEALRLAIELAPSAVRMGCGENLDIITKLVVERGSLEVISSYLLVCLLLGHDVDGTIAERCLDELDGRREERRWEYDQNWFQWEQLLVLMIFGGRPMQAAECLLTYDHRGQRHDERRIVEALGLCRDADALRALGMVRDRCLEQRLIDGWFSAVCEIGSAEAGDVALTKLIELLARMDWHGKRRASDMLARLVEKHPALRGRLLSIAESGAEAELKVVASIVSHLGEEDSVVGFLAIPGDRLGVIGGAIADSLRSLCVEHLPVEGSGGLYNVEPRAVLKLRARLFERTSANDSGSDTCRRLLELIDEIRDDYGRPVEEARHPDIAVGRPWPPAARRAWGASADLVARTAH